MQGRCPAGVPQGFVKFYIVIKYSIRTLPSSYTTETTAFFYWKHAKPRRKKKKEKNSGRGCFLFFLERERDLPCVALAI